MVLEGLSVRVDECKYYPSAYRPESRFLCPLSLRLPSLVDRIVDGRQSLRVLDETSLHDRSSISTARQ